MAKHHPGKLLNSNREPSRPSKDEKRREEEEEEGEGFSRLSEFSSRSG